MADFGGDVEGFRDEARGWLEANFPASLKGNNLAVAALLGGKTTPDAELWKERMGAKGWGTPTWPTEYGGGGLSPAQAKVLNQEMTRLGATNPIGGMGVMMFGPTLLEHGTEEQKQQHIPPIVRGELRWCQGYSEPNAGSDLAALQTKCEDKGDHWLVNGSKIWTSGANLADWCFCLVRTDNTRKHEGISFLLIDMKSPGVEVRPILMIAGSSPFCETFFTDVKVPKDNLMGPLNGGWSIGKRLLQFERQNLSGGMAGGGNQYIAGGSLADMAKAYMGADELGRVADGDLRGRIAAHEMETMAFRLTLMRAGMEAKAGMGPSATTSIMKNVGAKITQDRAELMLEIMGLQGLGWEGDQFSSKELAAVRAWLGGKAVTIYGGSSEIQNNVIAKRILGLLDHQ